jgi:hypothetical protein
MDYLTPEACNTKLTETILMKNLYIYKFNIHISRIQLLDKSLEDLKTLRNNCIETYKGKFEILDSTSKRVILNYMNVLSKHSNECNQMKIEEQEAINLIIEKNNHLDLLIATLQDFI